VDICDLKREAETLFLQCSDADDRMTPCYGGEIHLIVAGFYGAIVGECPSVSHTWK
jgi:hypothetical protein